MRINLKNIPSDTKLLHVFNHKKIAKLKSSDFNLDKETSCDIIYDLVYKMIKTCELDGGVGLAAPQLGVLKKVIIVKEFMDQNSWGRWTDYYNVFINPIIRQNKESELIEFDESCLSVPGARFPIKRYNEIFISSWGYGPMGEKIFSEEKIEGYYARVLQHEYDHLKGVSILDIRNQ